MIDEGRSQDGQRSGTDGEAVRGSDKPQKDIVHTPNDEKKTQQTIDSPKDNVVPLSPDIQRLIGEQLQILYSDLLTQETPDRFLKLLDELDRKSQKS